MEKTTDTVSQRFAFLIAVLVLLLLLAVTWVISDKMATKMESKLLTDTEILQNYREFQYIADQKGIARMPNDVAKKVPEIKKILDDRNALLAVKFPACTLEYRASTGERSAFTQPIKGHCDPVYFWKWFLI